jgi:hypothetical protein
MRSSLPDPRGSRRRTWLTMGLLFCGLASTGQTAMAQIKAVPLPDPQIPGYRFPESEATILNWIKASSNSADAAKAAEASRKIALHGWGIWTSLTAETNQVYQGQKIRVFETWFTPEDLTAGPDGGAAAVAAPARGRSPLEPLRQFRHRAVNKPGGAAAAVSPRARILGFVKYDPAATNHIVSQKLLVKSVLSSLLSDGANAIPPFPQTAVSLKPVFMPISKKQLVGNRYFPLPVWPGPPSPVKEFDSDQWPGVAWIDIQGGGAGKGKVDMTPPNQRDGSTRTDATTYPVSSLINFKLTANDAASIVAAGVNSDSAAGDYSILVGMHVTSKEITRWTWQTFWWTPSPDVAVAPSSSDVVAARPAQLRGTPRNYAMSIAYATESPAQPNVGGSNVGESMYTYNPWLEAGFGPGILRDSIPGVYQDQVVSNAYGVQTNCMSCHGGANYNPAGLTTAPDYTGDRYLSLDDPRFRGVLTVDFLWSIPAKAK